MITTVTMSIDRYKELESKEQLLNDMQNKKEVVLIRIPYGSDYFYHASFEETFKKMQEEIDRVSDYAEKWRIKAIK